MKFDVTAVYFALLRYINDIDEIPDGPTGNKELFFKLCRHFGLRKKEIKNFRTNLYFAWFKNQNGFTDKTKKSLLTKK